MHAPRPTTINPKLVSAGLAIVASLALGVTAALAGTARESGDPGITDGTVLLGGTAPLTGPSASYAAVAKGAAAYFRYVNARGGVNGRKILYKVADDGGSPAGAAVATRQLVEQDRVFALFNSVGTDTNLAVREELNRAKVPQLFVASGATTWGRDYAQYPYTTGFQPSYRAEGSVYGKYLARSARGATVAVLFQNDDFGKELLGGLKRGLQRSRARVVAAQPYDEAAVDVSAQIARLKASGADTLAIFATPAHTIQAYQAAARLGWKLARVVNSSGGAASTTMSSAAVGQNRLVAGTVSIAFLKDPADPQWKRDAALRLYSSVMAQYAPGADAGDLMHLYGMAAAWTAVEALRQTGRDLSRESLRKTVDAFTAPGDPFLLPGIVVKTAGADHYPIEQMLLRRWQNGAWRSFGGLWSTTGS